MKKNKTALIIAISLLLIALLGAAGLLLWNNPLFGKTLGTLTLPETGNELQAGGQPESSQSTSESQTDIDAVLGEDAEIKEELEEQHPELAAELAANPQSASIDAQTLCGGPDPLTVLVLGIDENAQADAIRLMRLDFVEEKISVVSVPRDFWVPVVDMKTYGIEYGRINATFGYGEFYNGKGGGIVSIATNLQANFGVNIDHYLVLHFKDIARYIDWIGGIDLTLEKPVEDGKLVFAAGDHHFDGQTAVAFMRMREWDSDFYRVRRQSLILTSFYKKAMDELSLWQLAKLGVNVILDKSISTDFAVKDVSSLACLASRITNRDVAFIEIPKDMYHSMTTNKGASVIVPHTTVPAFLQSVLDGTYTAK